MEQGRLCRGSQTAESAEVTSPSPRAVRRPSVRARATPRPLSPVRGPRAAAGRSGLRPARVDAGRPRTNGRCRKMRLIENGRISQRGPRNGTHPTLTFSPFFGESQSDLWVDPAHFYRSLHQRGHFARSSRSSISVNASLYSVSSAKPASTSQPASSTPSAAPDATRRVSCRDRA